MGWPFIVLGSSSSSSPNIALIATFIRVKYNKFVNSFIIKWKFCSSALVNPKLEKSWAFIRFLPAIVFTGRPINFLTKACPAKANCFIVSRFSPSLEAFLFLWIAFSISAPEITPPKVKPNPVTETNPTCPTKAAVAPVLLLLLFKAPL